MKAFWFSAMHKILSDDACQRLGTVAILYNIQMTQTEANASAVWMEKFSKCLDSLPLRLVSFHYCFSGSENLLPYASHTKLCLSTALRLRFRSHEGKEETNLSRLTEFLHITTVFLGWVSNAIRSFLYVHVA